MTGHVSLYLKGGALGAPPLDLPLYNDALCLSPRAYMLLRRRGHATSTTEIFSVTIFRTRSIGSIGACTCKLGLCLVILKFFDVCTVTMGVACKGVYKPLISS